MTLGRIRAEFTHYLVSVNGLSATWIGYKQVRKEVAVEIDLCHTHKSVCSNKEADTNTPNESKNVCAIMIICVLEK